MEPITALILSIFLGSLMTVESFRKLVQTHQAQKQLLKFLEKQGDKLKTLDSLFNKNPTKDDLEEAQLLIDASLEKLDKPYQDRIKEGLYQDSRQGQKNYIINLVRASLSSQEYVAKHH